jgi:hypothetical protein
MLAQGMLVIKGKEPIMPADFTTEDAGPTARVDLRGRTGCIDAHGQLGAQTVQSHA